MGGRLRAALGDSPEATLAIEFASSCLSTATYSSYGRLWAAFEDFCAQRRLCALPATAGTVACYVASLAASGRWQPGSLQPVLSAINRVHRDLLGVEDGPAQGALVTSVKRGWEARHAATPGVRSDVRRPLPASVASAALDAGLALLPSVIAGNPELLRSLVCVIGINELTGELAGWATPKPLQCLGGANTSIHQIVRTDYEGVTVTFCVETRKTPIWLIVVPSTFAFVACFVRSFH